MMVVYPYTVPYSAAERWSWGNDSCFWCISLVPQWAIETLFSKNYGFMFQHWFSKGSA